MASIWRRTMVYLGLVDDEDYDEYEPYPAEPAPQARPAARRSAAPPERAYEPEPPMSVRTLPAREPADNNTVQLQRPAVVRTLQPAAPTQQQKVHVVSPSGFNDAKEIGDRLKGSQPVIVNLQGVDRELARRLIDFSSGVAYGLGGKMEKAAESVFLLTPSNVDVSAEEKRRLEERGLYRP